MNTQESNITRRKGIVRDSGTRRQDADKNPKNVHVSPARVEKYLAGIHYPADKEKLVANAKQKSAPQDVMSMVQRLPEKTYNSPIDITKAIGKIE
jgi:hypothetical protein